MHSAVSVELSPPAPHLDEDEQPRRQSVGERENHVRRKRQEQLQRLKQHCLRKKQEEGGCWGNCADGTKRKVRVPVRLWTGNFLSLSTAGL